MKPSGSGKVSKYNNFNESIILMNKKFQIHRVPNENKNKNENKKRTNE